MRLGEAYSILEIDRDVDEFEVKKAYRRLALLYHPDKNGNSQESIEKFQLIQNAYELVMSMGMSDEEDNFGYNDDEEGFDCDAFEDIREIFASFFAHKMRAKFSSATGRGRGFSSFCSEFDFSFDPFEDMHDERRCDCPRCREIRRNYQERAEMRRRMKEELRRKKEKRETEEKKQNAALAAEEKLRKAKAKEEKIKRELEKKERQMKEAEEKRKEEELQAQRQEELMKQTESSRNEATARSSALMERMRSALDTMKPEDKDIDALNEMIKEAKELLNLKRPDDGTNLMTVSLGREKLTKLQKKILNLLTTDKNPEMVPPTIATVAATASTASASTWTPATTTEALKKGSTGSGKSTVTFTNDNNSNNNQTELDINTSTASTNKKSVKFSEEVSVTEISSQYNGNNNNNSNINNSNSNSNSNSNGENVKDKKSKEKKDIKKGKESLASTSATANNTSHLQFTAAMKSETVGKLVNMGFTEAQACRGFAAVGYHAGMDIDAIVSWILENHGSEETASTSYTTTTTPVSASVSIERQGNSDVGRDSANQQKTPERPEAPGFAGGGKGPYSYFGGGGGGGGTALSLQEKEENKEKTSPSPSSVTLGDADSSLDFINQLQWEGFREFSVGSLNDGANGTKGLPSTRIDGGIVFGANNASLFYPADEYPTPFDSTAMNLSAGSDGKDANTVDGNIELGKKTSFYTGSFYSPMDTALDFGDLDNSINQQRNIFHDKDSVGVGGLPIFPLYASAATDIDGNSGAKESSSISNGGDHKILPRMCKFDLKCRDGAKCKYRHSNDPVDIASRKIKLDNNGVENDADINSEDGNEECEDDEEKYVIINDNGTTIKLRSATARPCKFGEKCRDKRCTRRHTPVDPASTTNSTKGSKRVNNASSGSKDEPLGLKELAELKKQIDTLKPTLTKSQQLHIESEIAKMDITAPSTVRALQMFVSIMSEGSNIKTTTSISNASLCKEVTEDKGTEVKMCRYKNKCRDGAACKFRHPIMKTV